MARRGPSADELALRWRVAALEARVKALEKKLAVRPAPLRKVSPTLPRCPGCLLELPRKYLGTTCVWCGFALDAVPPLRPPRRGRARRAPGGPRST